MPSLAHPLPSRVEAIVCCFGEGELHWSSSGEAELGAMWTGMDLGLSGMYKAGLMPLEGAALLYKCL